MPQLPNIEQEMARRVVDPQDAATKIPGQLIPQDELAPYDPPAEYPKRARKYLEMLARNGTMSGACRLAGMSTSNVYKYREELDGFRDEEDHVRDLITDWIEERSFLEVLSSGTSAAVNMKQFMLRSRRRSTYGDRQEVNLNGNVTVSWLDIMKNVDEKQGEK